MQWGVNVEGELGNEDRNINCTVRMEECSGTNVRCDWKERARKADDNNDTQSHRARNESACHDTMCDEKHDSEHGHPLRLISTRPCRSARTSMAINQTVRPEKVHEKSRGDVEKDVLEHDESNKKRSTEQHPSLCQNEDSDAAGKHGGDMHTVCMCMREHVRI